MDKKTLEDVAERRQLLLEATRSEVGSKRVGFGDAKYLLKDTVPMGIPEIDRVLGGGLRKGRMVMVVGHESMGKTLFTQWCIRAFQRQGEICGFIDPEKTFDPTWFRVTGVSVEDLLVVHPESTEQAFDLACTWAELDMGLIVIDSLAALIPKARLDATLVKQEFMGLNPRKISEGLNRFTNININSVLLCTNQMRSKLGVVYGSPDEIPGGKAQRFYASYIIKIHRRGWIKEREERVGYHLGVEAIKNKLHEPYKKTSVPFLYTGVIDTVAGAVDIALSMNLLPKKGGYYTWQDKKYHGQKKLAELFRSDPVELEKLQDLIRMGE